MVASSSSSHATMALQLGSIPCQQVARLHDPPCSPVREFFAGEHPQLEGMDLDIQADRRVHIERERWVDSAGLPHEFVSFTSEPAAQLAQFQQLVHEVQLQGHINSVLHGGIQNIYGNLETITQGLHDAYQDDLATRHNLNILRSNFNDHVRGFDEVLRPYLAGLEHSTHSRVHFDDYNARIASVESRLGLFALVDRQISWVRRYIYGMLWDDPPPSTALINDANFVPLTRSLTNCLDALEIGSSQLRASQSLMDESLELRLNELRLEFREQIASVRTQISSHLPTPASCPTGDSNEWRTCFEQFRSQLLGDYESFKQHVNQGKRTHVSSVCSDTCSCFEVISALQEQVLDVKAEVTKLQEASRHGSAHACSCSCDARFRELSDRLSQGDEALKKLQLGLSSLRSTRTPSGVCVSCSDTCACYVALATRFDECTRKKDTQTTDYLAFKASVLQKVAALEALESSPSRSGASFDPLSALQTFVDEVGTRLSDTQDADHLQERVAALEIAMSEWDVHNGSNADLKCASQVFPTLMGSSSHAHVFHRDCGLNKERLCSHSVDSKLRAFEPKERASSRRSRSQPVRFGGNVQALHSTGCKDDFDWGDGTLRAPKASLLPMAFSSSDGGVRLQTLNVQAPSIFGGHGGQGDFEDVPPLLHMYEDEEESLHDISLAGVGISADFPEVEDFFGAVPEARHDYDPKLHTKGPDKATLGRVFGRTGNEQPDMEALDDDTRREVTKILKCPKWSGDYNHWVAFELQWRNFHNYWYRWCGADIMAKILLTTLPEAKRALYTQLHMSLGWTYQKIWLDLASRGRGLQSRKGPRQQWQASTPPKEKSLAAYGLWVLQWCLLAQKAAPVTALQAKDAYIEALHRHGGYEAELDELSHEGAHELVVYEMGLREDRDAVKRAEEASLRVLRGQGQKFQGACNYCGIKGHKEGECRKKKEDVAAGTPNKRRVRPSGGRTGGGAGRDRQNGDTNRKLGDNVD